jgi:hypothetical protein
MFVFQAKQDHRENLFHFCARYNLIYFCKKLTQLAGAIEALGCINKQGEYPFEIAMKNHFNQIANLM